MCISLSLSLSLYIYIIPQSTSRKSCWTRRSLNPSSDQRFKTSRRGSAGAYYDNRNTNNSSNIVYVSLSPSIYIYIYIYHAYTYIVMDMYVCVYIYIYIWIRMYIRMYTYNRIGRAIERQVSPEGPPLDLGSSPGQRQICVRVYICLSIYLSVYLSISVSLSLYIHIYVYVVYVYVSVQLYVYEGDGLESARGEAGQAGQAGQGRQVRGVSVTVHFCIHVCCIVRSICTPGTRITSLLYYLVFSGSGLQVVQGFRV